MTVAVWFKPSLSDYSRDPQPRRWQFAAKHQRGTPMRRLIIALAVAAVAAPMLSGCIIIASEKPTTRVIHSTPSEAN
jgi:hypothetical protein